MHLFLTTCHLSLAVFKLFSFVQLVPFQDSVNAVLAVEVPPKANASVEVPAPE
jgi:hypothetical protein